MPKSVVSYQSSAFSFVASIFLVFIWGFFSPPLINAQELNLISPTPLAFTSGVSVPPGEIINIRQNPYFFGQNHSYSVVFRGNGEAVVGLRLIFSNLGNLPLSEYSFRVPKVSLSDLMVYQIIKEPVCVGYGPIPSEEGIPRKIIDRPLSPNSDCTEYQAPDYYDAWGVQIYQKADIEKRGEEYVVVFPKEIESQSTGGFLLYYRALGYATKDLFGKYDYIFESLKINDKIENLNVGISVDEDLVLKGATGGVDYGQGPIPSGRELSAIEKSSLPFSSPVLDRFYQNIGTGGYIYKYASNLQVGESYLVKGSYADYNIKLYIKDILVYILIALVFVFLVVMGLKLLRRKVVGVGRSSLVDWLEVGGVALLSSFFAVGYTLLVIFILNNLFNFDMNDTSYVMFVSVLATVVSVGIYFLLLILPSVMIGVKKGMVYGLSTFGLTIILLFIYLVSIFMVSFLFRGTVERVLM